MIVKTFEVSELGEFPVTVRPVDTLSAQYEQLFQSVSRNGILTPLHVTTIAGKPLIFDGYQRIDIAKTIDITRVHCCIHHCNHLEVLVLQLQLNQYTSAQVQKKLIRIIAAKPAMTFTQLRILTSIREDKLAESSLLKALWPTLINSVIMDDVCMANALVLDHMAQVDHAEATKWLPRAIKDSPTEFVTACNAATKKLKTQKRQGKITRC